MNGFWERISSAFHCFISVLFRGELPDNIVQKLMARAGRAQPAPVATPSAANLKTPVGPTPGSFDRAVQMLGLLQRDGRLIDFLQENISAYPDAQLGAAVRAIHEGSRQALDQYVKLEPILNSEEDQPVTVQPGFDSTTIKLIGNVRGGPPLRGVLRHKGWLVKEVNLPPLSSAGGHLIVAPAEVELT